ncbi:F-box protein SKP2A [Chionoecetes opilio]|uniref:F-box protein SKP2A n=1 Tax=Chionoecetes opilio TaxID=41210 RepID=A0A8J8WE38_CHIOP|nr:F-box protein SKP2A [Chionoecetes opilio]
MNCEGGSGCIGLTGGGGGGAKGRGGHGRGAQRSRGRGRGRAAGGPMHIPDDLVDPCKVFVSNLRPQVSVAMLQEALSHYAAVEKVTIIKDKNTKRSKGYGFVKVKTQEDVARLLALCDADRYIQGREMTLQVAKKKISLPGDDSYVRRPLPDREFDLSPPDPALPSAHRLVDDVMFKILSYLPIRVVVRCEGVCRRWQMLVHRHFSKMTNLEINEEALEISPPFTKGIISKLLILSGPNLRALKVQRTDFATRQNILKIISQLCPVLEHLDVTKARGINFVHISKLAQGCRHIKAFIARNCVDFDEKALHQLLVSYPQLERLNVAGTAVYGKNFNLLPTTIKELCIERIPDLCHKKKKITEIADKCPNIEVLEMKECMLSKSDLEYFGTHCHHLTKLSVYMPSIDATKALASFKKLKDLTLVCDMVDMPTLFGGLRNMETLSLETRDIVNEEADFSVLEKLKVLKLNQALLSLTSLLTLTKCKHLEELHLFRCYSLPHEVLFSILKGCPRMKRVACPSLQLDPGFVTTLDDILRSRPGKLTIEARDTGVHLSDVQYDKKKLAFEHTRDLPFLFDPFSYDSDDSDYSDNSFNTSWYDSEMDFADHYLFDDDFHSDLLDAAVMLAAWNVEEPDLVWSV